MFRNLNLASKFTIFLSGVFIVSVVISGIILQNALYETAKTEVSEQSLLLMEMMNSVREYTTNNVKTKLEKLSRLEPESKFLRTTKKVKPNLASLENERTFIPEMVPAFSAKQVFENLHKNLLDKKQIYKNFRYREAVINPTNPQDKAEPFEKEIVKRFLNSSKLEESAFKQEKQVFYTARPIRVNDKSCLECHSDPQLAPKNMLIKEYRLKNGSFGGFGWKLNELIGVQIVYVPAKDVFDRAFQYLSLAMVIFVVVFALVILLIYLLIKQTVTQPVIPIVRLAQKISSEQLSYERDEEAEIKSLAKVARKSDELGQLARVFQQMAHAIYDREHNLTQQLQQLRTQREQMEVRTQSKNARIAYFKNLQEKAQTIRKKAKGSG